MDLVLETRTRAMAVQLLAAGPNTEHAMHEASDAAGMHQLRDRLFERRDAVERDDADTLRDLVRRGRTPLFSRRPARRSRHLMATM